MWRVITFSLIYISALIMAQGLYATDQFGDHIKISNKDMYIASGSPLEHYLGLHPEKRPQPKSRTTGCWRGYVASWEITENNLVLSEVNTWDYTKVPNASPLIPDTLNYTNWIFGTTTPITATWFSGTILVENGSPIQHGRPWNKRTFDNYIILAIKNGSITKSLNTTPPEFHKLKNSIFKSFQKSDEYIKQFKSYKSFGYTTLETDDAIFQTHFESLLIKYFEQVYKQI